MLQAARRMQKSVDWSSIWLGQIVIDIQCFVSICWRFCIGLFMSVLLPSVLWHCWLVQMTHLLPLLWKLLPPANGSLIMYWSSVFYIILSLVVSAARVSQQIYKCWRPFPVESVCGRKKY